MRYFFAGIILALLSGCCDLTDSDRFFLGSSEEEIYQSVSKLISIGDDYYEVRKAIKEAYPESGEWEVFYPAEALSYGTGPSDRILISSEAHILIWKNPSMLCTLSQLQGVRLSLFFDENKKLTYYIVNREIDSL